MQRGEQSPEASSLARSLPPLSTYYLVYPAAAGLNLAPGGPAEGHPVSLSLSRGSLPESGSPSTDGRGAWRLRGVSLAQAEMTPVQGRVAPADTPRSGGVCTPATSSLERRVSPLPTRRGALIAQCITGGSHIASCTTRARALCPASINGTGSPRALSVGPEATGGRRPSLPDWGGRMAGVRLLSSPVPMGHRERGVC